jgi:GntR family carbon starvation induced transcriptional regulator
MEAALDRDVERANTLMTVHVGYTLQVYAQSEPGADASQSHPKRKRPSGKA